MAGLFLSVVSVLPQLLLGVTVVSFRPGLQYPVIGDHEGTSLSVC